MEEYNKRLISLLKPILNKLSDDRKKYLEEELNNVTKNNQAIRLLIAYDIVNYLKKKEYSYTFRGNIDSSYMAYELGIIKSVALFRDNIQFKAIYITYT